MDYLRSLGTAAVSSIVQKSGLNLPFSLGTKFPPLDALNIWTLYDATKRDDATPVSVFEFNSQQRRNLLPVAQNAVRRLRVTRHPDILKFMDVVEADGTIYIMTERVRPLSEELSSWEAKPVKDRQDWLIWGLHRITNAISFVNSTCNAAHGTVRVSSIFLSTSGEWKLGGFELFSDPAEPNAILVTYAGDLNIYRMPENERGGWAALKDGPITATDAYALALLIFNLFNPTVSHPPFLDPPYNPPQPSTRGKLPPSLWSSFKKMLNPNPKGRMTPKALLDVGMAESLGENGDGERATLLRTIKDTAPTLPSTFATHLVLPALLTSLTHTTMSISAPSIIPLVIQLGTYVPSDEYNSLVLEPVVKLFANPDRGTRMAILDVLPDFADKLDKQTVSEKIWPHLQTGFTDTIPVIRETTVKAIGLLSDKFTERILNNDLLRHLARLQSDPEAPIRTNSIILIGRLGPTLGYNTRRKVLGAACAKALKIASRRRGACGKGRGTGSRGVGGQGEAFKAVAMLIQILEEHATSMPDTTLAGDGPPTLGLNTEGTLVSSAAGRLFAPTDMVSAITPVGSLPPPVPSETKPTFVTQISAPPVPSGSRPRGMQLGAHKASVSGALPGGWQRRRVGMIGAHEFESAPAESSGVNAVGMSWRGASDDEDPWAAFEDPAPPPVSIPVTELTSPPVPATPPASVVTPARTLATQVVRPSRIAALSPSPSPRGTPLASPATYERATSPVASPASVSSSAGMTKEEKAAEMARRKEERKQRIAQLKEQKKNVAGAKA
ncbi:hypothetical protein BJV77DRAFT_1067320 [Russula vinacea]|nr:hypothetical protein BJV77DRAFT_1067320 [Russula vinacea]